MSALAKAKYALYLQSDHWKARRQQAIQDANGHCQSQPCPLDYLRWITDEQRQVELDEWLSPNAYRLEVHHLSYANLGRELPEDLIVLCPQCHAAQHGLLPRDADNAVVSKTLEDVLTLVFVKMADRFLAAPEEPPLIPPQWQDAAP